MKLLWEIVKFLAMAGGGLLVAIAALAFIVVLLSLVMCIIAGWGPQGPMDLGGGLSQ